MKFALTWVLALGLALNLYGTPHLNLKTENGDAQSWTLDQILKIVPRNDSTVFHLYSGAKATYPTSGQKWVFAYSSVGQISSSSYLGTSSSGQITPNQNLHLKSQQDAEGWLLLASRPSAWLVRDLQGCVLSQSTGDVTQWRIAQGNQVLILQIRSGNQTLQYLLQPQN